MIDWSIHNNTNEKIYNVTSGIKIDLLSLANLVNEISDFKSEIMVWIMNIHQIMKEIGNFNFTSHKDAIQQMRDYFKINR